MRQHQVALQQFQLIGGNMGARQPAETRVDAVGRLALGGDVGNSFRGGVDGSEAGRIECQCVRAAGDPAQVCQREVAGGQFDHRKSCLYKLRPSLNKQMPQNKA
ncbi:hypothetical protein AWB69_08389 [Caballeronia udeis]|uniref:Uncharacterized protein n=1 Tax=Caballeronia udeis TaxID=1232866 RepID=A0A158JQ81_9BURK|nr:hypothetical protein AWB69_08389 [Caballeronia udeis]